MSTDAKSALPTTPEPTIKHRQQGIKIFMWPKVIFLYPTAIVALIEKHKGHRFEWVARHMDGHDIPLEVSGTAIIKNGRRLNVIMARDISERKRAELAARFDAAAISRLRVGIIPHERSQRPAGA